MIETSNASWSATLDEDRLRRLAIERLLAGPAEAGPDGRIAGRFVPSDFDLNPEARPAPLPHLKPAAVLVPIVTGPMLDVVLTERTAHLAAHAGQIAFPGGRIEADDDGPLAAAMRETAEEIGLAASFIEPLGYLEPYQTSTGFLVTPVVAAITPGFELKPDPYEVADVFRVPLAFLLDERNHRIDSRMWQGRERHFYSMPYEGRYIWGATAGIIRTLTRRLRPA